MTKYSCAVLTVSAKGARGEREDTSGPNLEKILAAAGFNVAAYDIVPDQAELISARLLAWVDEKGIDLLVTTGGTGVSPDDVTPEATKKIISREIPGIAEAMRLASLKKTGRGMLSRGIAGIRKESLIINLPGSKRAAEENLLAVIDVIPHALEKIKGGTEECGG